LAQTVLYMKLPFSYPFDVSKLMILVIHYFSCFLP